MIKHIKATLCILSALLFVMVYPVSAETASEYPGQIWIGGTIGEEEVSALFTKNSPQDYKPDERLSGLSYDVKTNTLSLSDFRFPALRLEITGMGADFTIRLSGENELARLMVTAYNRPNSVRFTGDGSLVLNKELSQESGFVLQANPDGEDSEICALEESCITSYAREGKYAADFTRIRSGSVKGECSPQLREEAITYKVSHTLIDDPRGGELKTYEVYTKVGDDALYAIQPQYADDPFYCGYIMVLLPISDSGEHFAYIYDFYDNGLTGYEKTDAVMDAYTPTYCTGYGFYKASGEEEWALIRRGSGSEIYYQLGETEPFAGYRMSNGKEDILYHVVNEPKEHQYQTLALAGEALQAGGFAQQTGTVENAFYIYADSTEWTLKAPHIHKGIAVAAKPASCTADGSRAYYDCRCGKVFEDADCTKEITALESWKLVKATGHDFAGNAKKCAVCGENNPNYKAPAGSANEAAGKKPITRKKPVTVKGLGKVTTSDKGTAALVEYKKSSKKSLSLPSTIIVGEVEYRLTTIKANAFKKAKKAGAITLPDTITKIKANAFAKSKIKTVRLTVKKGGKLTVSKNAFQKSKVTKIKLTVSKKASKKEIAKLKNAFKKAGIKARNLKTVKA